MRGPRFNLALPHDGYAWWYFDGISADGRGAFTVIFFIGSVFSPHYRRARLKGPTDPLRHCAVNVALYGNVGRAWAFGERSGATQSDSFLGLGKSSLQWRGDVFAIKIDERVVPWGRPLRGEILVYPELLFGSPQALHPRGGHLWFPVAPMARFEATFESPSLRFAGHAYHDANIGTRPLDDDFVRWSWGRAPIERDVAVIYDVHSSHDTHVRALRFCPSGEIKACSVGGHQSLARSPLFGIKRHMRSQSPPQVHKTLEDTPFYARSQLLCTWDGHPVQVLSEDLDMPRFKHPLVQRMLPYKITRH